MKNGKLFLLGAATLMLAACGGKAEVKEGTAIGLVHGAGYVGYATVKVEGKTIKSATLTEYCFPSYITVAEAKEGETTSATIMSHGTETTVNYYNTVKFGSYTLTATSTGYKTADGKTEKELLGTEAAATAWKDAIIAGSVEVNGNKTIMTNATICKDENGYGGAKFNWKANRDATVAAFVKYGEDLLKAAKKTATSDEDTTTDTKNWYVGEESTGATWTDLNTTKEGSLSYAQILVNALKAAK